jgi:hypothetical protein
MDIAFDLVGPARIGFGWPFGGIGWKSEQDRACGRDQNFTHDGFVLFEAFPPSAQFSRARIANPSVAAL